jgi:hypothetical protein
MFNTKIMLSFIYVSLAIFDINFILNINYIDIVIH